tara:strand:- start:285 stop:467 length:183 start_codon:yes stop_codon:yes gene_type:complete
MGDCSQGFKDYCKKRKGEKNAYVYYSTTEKKCKCGTKKTTVDKDGKEVVTTLTQEGREFK